MSDVAMSLVEIQQLLKVEKRNFNSFGEFAYRSKEDILEAVKPLAHERGCYVVVDDDVVPVAQGWVYIKSEARLVDAETGAFVAAAGWAREPESKPKMDVSQTTGSAASYAGKRALGNLFALDDTADADAQPQQPASGPFVGECTACGARYQFDGAEHMAQCACACGNRQFRAVS